MNRIAQSQFFKFIPGLLATAFSLTICFCTLEFYIRNTQPKIDLYVLTGRIPGPNPMDSWAHIDAFSAYRGKHGQYSEGKSVNQFGFISTPKISVIKPKNTIRIIFLGGSSTAGTGWNLKDEETWPWLTVQFLRKELNIKIDFINAALGGYSSFESYGRLWSRLRHFSPDFVILNHGWNEMYYFNSADNIVNWRTLKDGSWRLDRADDPIISYSPNFLDPLIRWSQLLTYFRLKFSSQIAGEVRSKTSINLETSYNKKGLEIWRTNLKLIEETCNIIGAKLFVIKQPTLIVANLSLSEQKRCRYDFHGFDHNAHVDAYSKIYKIIDEEIERNFIIDATVLSGNPELFFDHVHPNTLGSFQLAQLVSRSLLRHLEN